MRIREERIFGHHHDVAQSQQLSTEADGCAPDRGNDRKVRLEHRREEPPMNEREFLLQRRVSGGQLIDQ